MRKPPIRLQALRRRIDAKAQAAPSWRFWGLDVHVCTLATLREASQLAKANHGAPGVDGVTVAAIEASGRDGFLEQ
jgi:RNA-directed DNA polymerase